MHDIWRTFRREPLLSQIGVGMFAAGLLTQTGIAVYILATW